MLSMMYPITKVCERKEGFNKTFTIKNILGGKKTLFWILLMSVLMILVKESMNKKLLKR